MEGQVGRPIHGWFRLEPQGSELDIAHRRGIESFGVKGPLLHRLNPCLHILISLMLWISQDAKKGLTVIG